MILVKQIDESYNNEMLDILKSSPMRMNYLDLHFDKSPNLFSSTKMWSNNFKYYGVFVDGKLAGFGMYLIYLGYVGNKVYNIVYSGNFCIEQKQRKKGLLIKLAEVMLIELRKEGDFGFCMILKGNKLAERYFKNDSFDLPSLPTKKIILPFESKSILVLQPMRLTRSYVIKTAEPADVAQMDEFIQKENKPSFLCPIYYNESIGERIRRKSNLELHDYYLAFEGKDIVGICAAWDSSGNKRTRVLNYKKGFILIKLIYRLISKFLKYPDLPKKGNAIKERYITDVVIKEHDFKILEALLRAIYEDCRIKKYNLINFGSYKNDSLLDAAKPFYSMTLPSKIYFSANDSESLNDNESYFSRPFVDVALI